MKMNNMIRMGVALLLALPLFSCKKVQTPEEPVLPVTYANLNGYWRLHTWKGNPLPEGACFYIEFNRKDRTFVMHQNIDTIFDRILDGSFEIEEDEYGNYVVSGTYNWGRGDWNTGYYVTNLTAVSMTWTSVDSPEDVSVYERIESLPEELE